VTREADERRRLALDQYAASTAKLDARAALHARFSIAPQPWHEWLFDQIALAPGEVVVEMGAGTGLLWISSHGRVPARVQLHLTDLSMAMCSRLQADTREATSVSCMSAEQLAFRSDVADVVVANHMLYHVPDQRAALEEAARVLRPGGRAVFATNGRNHMSELWEILAVVGIQGAEADATHRSFLLEDAAEIVRPVFPHAKLATFEDGLRVSDADAVAAYIESFADVEPSQRRPLLAEIARRMTDGFLSITKSAGVVTAVAP
jgi:SAM-dependent methyltransferase